MTPSHLHIGESTLGDVPSESRAKSLCLKDGTQTSLASWPRRVMARAIDTTLLSLAVLLAGSIGFITGLSRDFSGHASDWYAALLGAVAWILMAVVEITRTSRTGQTFGKAAVGIVVVDTASGRIPYGKSATRLLVPSAIAVIGTGAVLELLFPGEELPHVVVALVFYGCWFGLPAVWLLMVLTRRRNDRRCWHDRAADTIVAQVSSSRVSAGSRR